MKGNFVCKHVFDAWNFAEKISYSVSAVQVSKSDQIKFGQPYNVLILIVTKDNLRLYNTSQSIL